MFLIVHVEYAFVLQGKMKPPSFLLRSLRKSLQSVIRNRLSGKLEYILITPSKNKSDLTLMSWFREMECF